MTTHTATSGSSPRDSVAAVNPSALTVEQLARALGVAAEVVRRHVQDGVPTDGGGRINLIQYAAWLNMRLAQAWRGEDDRGD